MSAISSLMCMKTYNFLSKYFTPNLAQEDHHTWDNVEVWFIFNYTLAIIVFVRLQNNIEDFRTESIFF